MAGTETFDPTDVLHVWAQQQEISYTWIQDKATDDASDHVNGASAWQFAVRLTPKSREKPEKPVTYSFTAPSPTGPVRLGFNNPYVAMDALSTWVLFRRTKPAERCRSKIHKPYQLLWDSWRDIEKACGDRLRTLRDEMLPDAGSANTGFTGMTGTQQYADTKHFAERKQERNIHDLDVCRTLKW